MAEKLKIAFYTDTYLPAVDGVVTSIINSREELTRRGHEIYIFTSGDRSARPIVEIEKNVFAVPGVKFKKYPQYRLAIFPFLSSVKLNEIKPDIIHSHTPFMMGLSALLLAKINRIPIVGTFHTFFTDKKVLDEYGTNNEFGKKMMIKYSWPYARFFYTKCNRVIAPSHVTMGVLSKHGIENTVVVPNSVDLKKFNPSVSGEKLREKLLNGKDGKIVMYLGRMSKEKRIDVILRAAKRLQGRNIKFVFVGSGPSLNHYTSMAARYGLGESTHFTGFVESSMLPKYYAASDVFCTASTFETQGVVLLEAMALGKPVVGADALAIKEIVKNGRNGEKFKPGDSKSCAKMIERVINNIDSYKETVETAKKYSVKKTTDMLLDVYRELIHDSNPERYLDHKISKSKSQGD
jgi:1,2-diacylglycerol 3-alpha-glucosyltransferase